MRFSREKRIISSPSLVFQRASLPVVTGALRQFLGLIDASGLFGKGLWLSGSTRFLDDGGDESFKIGYIRCGDAVYKAEIELSVFVGDHVSKSDGVDHFFGQLAVKIGFLFQHVKHFVGTAGNAKSFGTDDVRSNIDAILDGHLEVEHHDILKVAIFFKAG